MTEKVSRYFRHSIILSSKASNKEGYKWLLLKVTQILLLRSKSLFIDYYLSLSSNFEHKYSIDTCIYSRLDWFLFWLIDPSICPILKCKSVMNTLVWMSNSHAVFWECWVPTENTERRRARAGGKGHGNRRQASAAQFIQTWLLLLLILSHGVGYLFPSSFVFGTHVPLVQGSISWVSLCSTKHFCSLSFDDLRV